MWFQLEREIPSLTSDVLFDFGFISISSSTLLIGVILVLLLVLAYRVRRFSIVPSKFQIVVESLFEGMYSLLDTITNDRKVTEKIFPIVGSILTFIAISNLIGLIPGIEQLTWEGKELLRTPTSDFSTTFSLALGTVLVVNFISLRKKGVLEYLNQFFNFKGLIQGFKKGIGPGLVSVVEFFVGVMDIVGELVKVVSLSLRLFGNMYAGQILTIILLGIFSLALPSLWLAMNIFVGILQAVVFASLVTAYYMLAVGDEEELEKEMVS